MSFVAIAFGNSIVRPTTTARSVAVTRKLVHMDGSSLPFPGREQQLRRIPDGSVSPACLVKLSEIETLIQLCGTGIRPVKLVPGSSRRILATYGVGPGIICEISAPVLTSIIDSYGNIGRRNVEHSAGFVACCRFRIAGASIVLAAHLGLQGAAVPVADIDYDGPVVCARKKLSGTD